MAANPVSSIVSNILSKLDSKSRDCKDTKKSLKCYSDIPLRKPTRSMEALFVFSLIFMRLRKDLPYSDESEMHKRSLRVSNRTLNGN